MHADRLPDLVEDDTGGVVVAVAHGTQSVEAGYMANAWVRVRHHDYDSARAILDDVGQTIRMHARS